MARYHEIWLYYTRNLSSSKAHVDACYVCYTWPKSCSHLQTFAVLFVLHKAHPIWNMCSESCHATESHGACHFSDPCLQSDAEQAGLLCSSTSFCGTLACAILVLSSTPNSIYCSHSATMPFPLSTMHAPLSAPESGQGFFGLNNVSVLFHPVKPGSMCAGTRQ